MRFEVICLNHALKWGMVSPPGRVRMRSSRPKSPTEGNLMRRQQNLIAGPAIRSGKIKGPAGKPVLVASAKGKRTYRVFNAGLATVSLYDIKDPTMLPSKIVSCQPGCSVDLEVKTLLWAQSPSKLDAIFDLVNGVRPIRSGRVRSPLSGSATAPLTLDGGHDNPSILRVLNSGETNIEVSRSGVAIASLAKKQSVDVGYENQEIKVSPTDLTNFEAIYDRIDLLQPTRSGRFSIDAPVPEQPQDPPKPAPETVIADLGSLKELTYRLFNSGTSPFLVVLTEEKSGKQTEYPLLPEQSFDLTPKLASNLSVKGTVVKASIKGIYEYVG